VHERLRAAGLSLDETDGLTEAASQQVLPLAEPAVLYFHRRALARAWREDLVTHLEQSAGLLDKVEVPGQLRAAIVFVDLSSFSALAEAMGDEAAAGVLNRFSELVREAVHRSHGRLVKQIGDAFMLVFPDPTSAIACALAIESRAAAEGQFPAVRSGVHWGSVLYREGDYLGSNVNIAARLAAEAQRHQVLVTAAVRTAARALPEVEFVPLGKRRLKGLSEELELFEAYPGGVASTVRIVDPVCGMELQPQEVAATLSMGGEERAFCSEECLRRFTAASERYAR
jgi:class 3 adenylate cyclase/YHS domain-containing protein